MVGAATRSRTHRPNGHSPRQCAGPTNEIAITPDGTRIVYVGNNQTQLLVRALDDLEPRPLVDGNNIRGVFVVPGQSIGRLHRRRQCADESRVDRRPGDPHRESGCFVARRRPG